MQLCCCLGLLVWAFRVFNVLLCLVGFYCLFVFLFVLYTCLVGFVLDFASGLFFVGPFPVVGLFLFGLGLDLCG